MTSTRILAGLLAISAGIFSQAAGAQDNAANGVTEAHPGLTTAPAAPAGHPLFHGVKTSISGELSSSPVLTFGWNVDAALFAIGVGFKYDPNGLMPAPAPKEKFSFTLFASAAYMLYNTFPFACGPELGFVTALAPGDAITGYSQLLPALALWYAPFNAPILLGTALQLPVTFTKGREATIQTTYPGVRVIWAF
jgi:hypothetical protein